MNLSPRKRRCCYLDQEVVGHPRNEPRWNASMFPGWRDGVRGAGGVAGPTAELGSPGSGEERCSGLGWHGARLGRTRLSPWLQHGHIWRTARPPSLQSLAICAWLTGSGMLKFTQVGDAWTFGDRLFQEASGS